ncbi:MAG: hypothetical protein PUK08_01295 [Campylobacter lanienae]|uniref:hypothetical protein n=1 Tax=Campylobacter lanienae TaxID=75658 RepID=UPI00242F1630|nr:hypothetical protein [Campylobacter lanienae]MDD7513837.1 hypothetical protein [Campylobacter lanienae]
MAKKIKFNLQVNGASVSSLESLQNNFNIEDIMEHFKSGLLMRWLEVQGLETELKELKKLDQNSDNLAQSILKIFDMDFDKNALKIILNDINYKEYKENLLKTNENLDKNAKSFLREYHNKFHDIIWDIIKNSENVEKIKSNLKIIENDYFDLFLLQFQTLVNVFKTDAPLALIFGLGTEKIRKMLLAYINIEETQDHNKYCYIGDEIEVSVNGVVASIKDETKEYLNSINLKPIDYLSYGYFEAISKFVYESLKFDYSKLGDVIKRFDGSTEGLWRDLVASNKKVLILGISDLAKASRIPKDGETNEALGKEEIDGKFLILDGLNFQSSANTASIEYVEL